MDTPEGLTEYEQALPKRVQLIGTAYDLIITPHDHPALDGAEGLTDFRTCCIYLQQGLPVAGLLNVLWHELTHAVNEAGDISNGVKEERICAWHGQAWPTLLQMNPHLLGWINAALHLIDKERNAA